MATGVITWSETAATNASADGNVNFAEGMAPSQINDSARAMMASVAKWRDDKNGTLTTSGSSSAFTVATNQVQAALTNGYEVAVRFHANSALNATLAVDGLTAEPIILSSTSTGLPDSAFIAGSIASLTYISTATAWLARGDVQPSARNYASLTQTDQTLSGGANVTSFAISSSTAITIDCGKSPLQYITRNNVLTVTAPSADGSCILNITNAAGASTLSFSGFTVGSNVGDATSTSSGNTYSVSIWRINGVSSYFIKSLQ